MSIEGQAKRQLIRAACWRVVTASLALPCYLLQGLAHLVNTCANWFDAMSDAAFYFEADAARKYRHLTGVDLGLAASGNLNRYAGTSEKAYAEAEAEMYGDGEEDGGDYLA